MLTNKTASFVLAISAVLLILIVLCSYGLYKGYPHFYDGEGNELPYHAVDSLVQSQYLHISPAGADTVMKYFNVPVIDLPPEYRLIQPDRALKGHWQGSILYIEFNSIKNN